MLKSLFPAINWESVRVVGFDLDGALYDECDFITQVYRGIAERLASASAGGGGHEEVHAFLVSRWLEKGSLYPRIFAEAVSEFCPEASEPEALEMECVAAFRSFRPELRLSGRAAFLLDWFAERYALFLVTDGRVKLQRAKVDALGLGRWFSENNIVVTGALGRGEAKPSTAALGHIGILKDGVTPGEVAFFGDRGADAAFAEAAGFQFQPVRVMHAVQQVTE